MDYVYHFDFSKSSKENDKAVGSKGGKGSGSKGSKKNGSGSKAGKRDVGVGEDWENDGASKTSKEDENSKPQDGSKKNKKNVDHKKIGGDKWHDIESMRPKSTK